MKTKLSAVAMGITLAFGAGTAMAVNDDATIYQNGYSNDASIEQYDNNGAYASVWTRGNDNESVIVQQRVSNANASIYQNAYSGEATINQSGSHYSNGNNQHAFINQNSGWGNEAWTTQTGTNVDAGVNQDGYKNVAGILQKGSHPGWSNARINQNGSFNDGYIQQDGSKLVATINQTGKGNDAVILQSRTGHNATITQVGNYNVGFVKQR